MHENDRGASLVKRAPETNGHTHDACAGGGSSRQPLSCTRIVDAALQFVDANCLGDLSMRRLGGELGVEAMSLYRYFPSKALLLEGIVRRVLGDLALPSPDAEQSWEPQVRAYAHAFRSVARQHPHLIPLLATQGPINPTLASIHERLIGLWQQAGLDRITAGQAQCALQGYLTGSSLWDAPVSDGRRRSEAPAARGRHRRRARPLATIGCECGNADADFEFGLDALMRGLQLRVAEAASAG